MLFGKTGYIEFGYDEQIAKWAECAKKKSSRILANPAHLQKWLQCEGTWFVGVDVLPNNSRGDFKNTELPNNPCISSISYCNDNTINSPS